MVMCGMCSAKPCCRSDTSKKPDWTITVSWPSAPDEKDCTWDSSPAGQLIYTRENRAIIAVHIGCFRTTLSQFDRERYLAAHTIDILFAIDTGTGKIVKQTLFKDVSEKRERGMEVQILPVAKNKVLLRSDFALKLLTDDLEEICERSLIVEQEEWEHWKAVASADGSTLMLRRWGVGETNRDLSEDHWMSTDTLQDLLVDDPKPYRSMFFTIDHAGVYFDIKGAERMYGKVDDPVAFRAKGQTRYRLLCADCTGNARAVSNNGLLFLDHGPHADFMLIRNGDVHYRGHYGAQMDNIYAVTAAANSNRVAFEFGHGGAGLFALVGADRGEIIVFDADKMKPALSIKEKLYPGKEGPLESWPSPTIALSPDGTQLLILYGRVLKAFGVPGMRQ